MKVEMIYHTPELHKLVESVARVCYQSYSKVGEESHNMLKGIMAKGHLSVASVGTMVFKVEYDREQPFIDVQNASDDLMIFKEISNFVRWSFPSERNKDTKFDLLVSMNMLAFMDVYREYPTYFDIEYEDNLMSLMLEEVKKVPYLHWFIDKTVEVAPTEQPYVADPKWYEPVVLSQDYTALKALGLTDYELDMHVTITVDVATDRTTGLQMWRHADQVGGCELSQRYVDRSNADFRIPVGLEDLNGEDDDWEGYFQEWMNSHVHDYVVMKDELEKAGVQKMRAKEIARNLLPNIQTRILQCRPLRQWKHYFDLRLTPHAQAEIRKESEALIVEMRKSGVEI